MHHAEDRRVRPYPSAIISTTIRAKPGLRRIIRRETEGSVSIQTRHTSIMCQINTQSVTNRSPRNPIPLSTALAVHLSALSIAEQQPSVSEQKDRAYSAVFYA